VVEVEGAVLLALVVPEELGTTPVMLGILTTSLELEVSSEVGTDTGGIPVFVTDVTTCVVDSVTGGAVVTEDAAELKAEETEIGPPGIIGMLLDAVLYDTKKVVFVIRAMKQ